VHEGRKLMSYLNRAKAWFQQFYYNVINGKEPLFVAWVVSTAVAVAAKYGFDLNADMIWLFLGITFPAMVKARTLVDPTLTPDSIRDIIKRAVVPPDPAIELDPDDDDGPAGVVDEADLDDRGQPPWLEEYMAEVVVAEAEAGEDDGL
jgi:hypothetical protein